MKIIKIFATAFLYVGGSLPGFADGGVEINLAWEPKASISFDVYPGKQINLSTHKGELRIDYNDGKGEQILSRIEGEDAREDGIWLQINDFNFDGLMDIAVNDMGHGYAGFIIDSTIYAYDRKVGKFLKFHQDTNVDVDTKNKLLLSYMDNGPRKYGFAYKIRNGRPYLYRETETMAANLLKVIIKAPEGAEISTNIIDVNDDVNGIPKIAKRRISAAKATLYSGPQDTAKTNTYLNAGDKVEILGAAGQRDEWFKIRYQGRTSLVRWVKSLDIADEE